MERRLGTIEDGVRGQGVVSQLESTLYLRQGHFKDTFQDGMIKPGLALPWPHDLLQLEVSYVFLEASNPTELLRKRWQVLKTQAPWVDSIDVMAELRQRRRVLPVVSFMVCLVFIIIHLHSFVKWSFCLHDARNCRHRSSSSTSRRKSKNPVILGERGSPGMMSFPTKWGAF